MLVRQARMDDINAITELFWDLDTNAIHWQPEHFQRGERTDEYFSGIIQDEKSDFLVAVKQNEIVGFAHLYEKEVKGFSLLVPCRYAYLQDLVVKEKLRNKGIGSLLIEKSKAWAKERRLEYLRLSVFPDNKDAQRFYFRHGLYHQMITMECRL